LKDVREDSFHPEVVEGFMAEPPGVEELISGPKFIFIRVRSRSSNMFASVSTASNRLAHRAERESMERVADGRAVVGAWGAWCPQDVAC